MSLNNQQIAELLRKVAASLTLQNKNIFQIKAYQTAADGIEHLTAEVEDLWSDGKLDRIPGVGESLAEHLEELFKTGKVNHFDSLINKYPEILYQLLNIPGVGPKTALKLTELGVSSIPELKEQLASGKLVEKGFSQKINDKLIQVLKTKNQHANRMLLPQATTLAQGIIDYLEKSPLVVRADSLGSLRRKVATIGDLDFSACSSDPNATIEYFVKMPGIVRVVEQGDDRAAVVLKSGLHLDLLVGKPASYGAMLQHFTGSKHHNIHLRTYALKQGYSLSEEGVLETKTDKLIPIKKEEELYAILKMQTPIPEMREDAGEIEAALKHQLPKVIDYGQLKGDLHLHSSYPIEPSHDLGSNTIPEMVKKAKELGYDYLGISDHSPSLMNHTKEQISRLVTKRGQYIEHINTSTEAIRVLNGLEVDIQPNGNLTVPDEALASLDYVIVGVHSSHNMEKAAMTKRILTALSNPHTTILAHPTGRILSKRASYDADWEEIFKFAKANKKLMEINAHYDRLDLRDDLVRMAVEIGVKLIINSDAHHAQAMENLPFGVSVARRGWATAEDVVNTGSFTRLKQWLNKKD